jgi:hypothetical protein
MLNVIFPPVGIERAKAVLALWKSRRSRRCLIYVSLFGQQDVHALRTVTRCILDISPRMRNEIVKSQKKNQPTKRFFTLHEAMERLHLRNYKTLRIWLARTGVQPMVREYADGSKARGKYVTAEQIEKVRAYRAQFGLGRAEDTVG